jgi:hypothetical protein
MSLSGEVMTARLEPPAVPRTQTEVRTHGPEGVPVRERASLVDDLARQMPGNRVREYFAAKPEVWDGMDLTTVARDPRTGHYIAFLCSRWLPDDGGTLMLYTLLVADRYQRGHATFSVIQAQMALALAPGAPPFRQVALKTAHPRSYRAMEAFESLPDAEFFPSRRRANSVALRAIARAIAARLHPDQDFDDKTGTIRGAAGAVPLDFYPDAPSGGDAALNSLFAERVGLCHRMLCVLSLPTPRALDALRVRLRLPTNESL